MYNRKKHDYFNRKGERKGIPFQRKVKILLSHELSTKNHFFLDTQSKNSLNRKTVSIFINL